MCGRFTLATPPEILAALFELHDLGDWNGPRYNIAPQTRVLTVGGEREERVAQSLLWGALNPRDSRPLINARSETVATSPLFAPAFTGSRLLIPADGFFEWAGRSGRRQGFYFQQPGGGPFAFAGLAVNAPPASGEREPSAIILTAPASDSVKPIHDRMPLMVARENFGAWLDHRASPRVAADVISAGLETNWTSHAVGPRVNNVRNDTPDCIRAAEHTPERQGTLF
jgi:putative SOS response-associated peptidase YedK